ncbi:RNA recognition motif domain-containing protein [Desulfovibrio sp. TomC]|uniref:RNA recognition motif domain-containing protein n=1 Tax=Desulfovibrio sp. TomC TaxID=1562888 RepID=UPI0005747158|nr:RNA-binding protein [Desulfovibrio sp. TomC]KHK00590.1 RNA-binding protein [Desulfovibrio sp. TomC]
MSKKLYVGNLPFSTNEDELRDLFAAYGEVTSVKLIEDRETGRLRGFGFVEMAADGADAAMQGLNGKAFGGRDLRVNEAEERQPRAGGFGGDRSRRNSW